MVRRCFGALVRVRLTKQQGRAAHTQPAHTTPHTTVTTGTHNPWVRRWDELRVDGCAL